MDTAFTRYLDQKFASEEYVQEQFARSEEAKKVSEPAEAPVEKTDVAKKNNIATNAPTHAEMQAILAGRGIIYTSKPMP